MAALSSFVSAANLATNGGRQMEENLTLASTLASRQTQIAQLERQQQRPSLDQHSVAPSPQPPPLELGASELALVVVLISIIIISIVGNCLVCVAIFTDRRLRKLGNAFIVSLAVADLFVSCLVMTFALFNDLMNYWMFGDWFCDIWISFDVMCCTASILNLCAISLDRFIHIKDCLLYNQWMTRRVALSAVIIIWFISALVSFVPITLGWHKPSDNQALLRLQQQQQQRQELHVELATDSLQGIGIGAGLESEWEHGARLGGREQHRSEKRRKRRRAQVAPNRDVLKDYFANGNHSRRLLAKGVNSMNGERAHTASERRSKTSGGTTSRGTTIRQIAPQERAHNGGPQAAPNEQDNDDKRNSGGGGGHKLNYFYSGRAQGRAIENRLEANSANRRQIKEAADFVSSATPGSSGSSSSSSGCASDAGGGAAHRPRRRRQAATSEEGAAAALVAPSGGGRKAQQTEQQQLAQCMLTLTPTYAVVSSTISFYIPCIIMLGLYSKLFACARRHVRNIRAISRAVPPALAPLAAPAQRATRPAASVAAASASSGGPDSEAPVQRENTSPSNCHSMTTGEGAESGDTRGAAASSGQLQAADGAQTGVSQVTFAALPPAAGRQQREQAQQAVQKTSPSPASAKQGPPGPARTWIKFGRKERPKGGQGQSAGCDKAINSSNNGACGQQQQQDAEREPFLEMSRDTQQRQPPAQAHTSAAPKSARGGCPAEVPSPLAAAALGHTSPSSKSASGIRFNLVAAVSGGLTGGGSWRLKSPSSHGHNAAPQRGNTESQQVAAAQQQQLQNNKQTTSQLATHKAAITLGIIMGTFLFCWVPFFCLNIIKAFCVDCIPSSVFRAFTWLGYANSALNPIIYGIHNSEFRNAFNRIFFKHLTLKNGRQYLSRRFSYDLRSHHQQQQHGRATQNHYVLQQQALCRPLHQCHQSSAEP